MTGGLDESATRVGADAIVAAVPGGRRIDLPDVAHMPSLERPEWFTATLLEFPASVP
jgi:pimeloyl-ACP methyl ester carboxylesterase